MVELFKVHLSGLSATELSKAIDEAKNNNPYYPDNHGYNWTVFKFKPDSSQHVLQLAKTALSFSIVRHPFERLVSAYENKLVGPSVMGTWFRNNYGEPTFEKFARMIIQNYEGCQQNFCRSLNEHWRPFLEACSYCDIDYTFITKIENFERDFRILMDLLEVTLNPEDDKKKKVKHLNRSPGEDIKVKTKKYLDTLSRESLRGLMLVFKHDFEMFSYDPYEHINRTRKFFTQ